MIQSARIGFLERELREAFWLAPGPRHVEDIIADALRSSTRIEDLEAALRHARGGIQNAYDGGRLSLDVATRFFQTPTVLGADCTWPPGLEAFT